MLNKVVLYGNEVFKYNSYKEWNNEYRICVEPEQQFYDILKTEKMPFRDFMSKKLLKDVYDLEFRSEKDRYAMRQENGRNISLIMIPDEAKQALVLIKNSVNEKYTRITKMSVKLSEFLRNLDYVDYLIAFYKGASNGEVNWRLIFNTFTDMEVLNYDRFERTDKVRISRDIPSAAWGGYQLNKKSILYNFGNDFVSDADFFYQYEFDWRNSIYELYEDISSKYDGIVNKCDKTYELKFDNKELKTVISHIKMLRKKNINKNRLPVICIDYKNDGCIILRQRKSYMYNAMDSVLFDMQYVDDKYNETVDKTFFIVADVDMDIKSERELLNNVWFGGYLYKNCFELYDADGSLMEFGKVIADITSDKNIYREWD